MTAPTPGPGAGSNTPGELDEAALAEAIAADPNAALAELYERHGHAVLGLARRVLLDQGRAEEITQEVFFRLWRTPSRYDHTRGSLRSYLLADCHGRAVDLIRAESSRRRREARDLDSEVRRVDEGAETVALYAEELTHEIRDALKVLPRVELVAISLAYYGGYTYREVAKLVDLPEGTVKSQIRRGLIRLRVELDRTTPRESNN